MKVYNSENYNIKNPVVTIGSFDGVHVGHSAILNTLKKRANELSGETVVITFEPHPRIALGHDTENLFFLNSMEEKKFLLEQAGIDHLIILPFTKELAALTMEQFFIRYIKENLQAKTLVVGYNHRFGSDRNSDYDTLRGLGERENIEVIRVDKKGIDERDISSTTIRNLLKRGDLNCVNRYLSHPYFFISDIDSTGVALYYSPKKLYPPQGEYNVIVEYDTKKIETQATITRSNALILKDVNQEIKQAIIYFIN